MNFWVRKFKLLARYGYILAEIVLISTNICSNMNYIFISPIP